MTEATITYDDVPWNHFLDVERVEGEDTLSREEKVNGLVTMAVSLARNSSKPFAIGDGKGTALLSNEFLKAMEPGICAFQVHRALESSAKTGVAVLVR